MSDEIDQFLDRLGSDLDYYIAAKDKQINELRADNARLRAALEAVEWAPSEIDGIPYCLWCGNDKHIGHSLNCKRQFALGTKEGEG